MLQRMKDHRHLALGVAIALTASGSMLFAGAPAEAAGVTITADQTGEVVGSKTTNKTSGNEVIVGIEGSFGYTPRRAQV